MDEHLRAHLSWQRPGWLLARLLYRDLRRAAPLARGRLLDIGCGQMPYRSLFPQVSAYVGVDHPNAYHPEDRPALWGDGLRLPFADGTLDSALATQILEHVPEPARMLAEISRVLCPGGVLILTVPHIWDLHEQPNDFYRYTRYGIAYLLNQAGFDVERIVPQGGFFVMVFQRSSYFAFRVFQKLRLRPIGSVVALGLNVVGLALDRLYCYEGDTLNYLAVGVKR